MKITMYLHELLERGLLYHGFFFKLNVMVSAVFRHRFQYLDWRTAYIPPFLRTAVYIHVV